MDCGTDERNPLPGGVEAVKNNAAPLKCPKTHAQEGPGTSAEGFGTSHEGSGTSREGSSECVGVPGGTAWALGCALGAASNALEVPPGTIKRPQVACKWPGNGLGHTCLQSKAKFESDTLFTVLLAPAALKA